MRMTEEQYTEEVLFGTGSPGVCLECDAYDEYAGCEPDAEGYECGDCGAMAMMGAETALMVGAIEIAG